MHVCPTLFWHWCVWEFLFPRITWFPVAQGLYKFCVISDGFGDVTTVCQCGDQRGVIIAIINLCLCNDVCNLWDVALSSVMVSVVLMNAKTSRRKQLLRQRVIHQVLGHASAWFSWTWFSAETVAEVKHHLCEMLHFNERIVRTDIDHRVSPTRKRARIAVTQEKPMKSAPGFARPRICHQTRHGCCWHRPTLSDDYRGGPINQQQQSAGGV